MVYHFYYCAHIDARATGATSMRSNVMMALAVAMLAASVAAHAQYAPPVAVGKSEVGPDDELGRLSW
jgi:hypothetical protein